jgi:hypothetical protein
MRNHRDNGGGDLLTDDEKLRVALQVDHFIEVVEKRTGISFAEVVGLVIWARERKQLHSRISLYAYISIVGLAVSGIAYGILEGLKHIFNGAPPK